MWGGRPLLIQPVKTAASVALSLRHYHENLECSDQTLRDSITLTAK